MELHIFRHGESLSNAKNLITGTQDVALSNKGMYQAVQLGLKLDDHYDLTISSTLRRARQTLDIALSTSNTTVTRSMYDCRLNERCMGVLEGQPQRFITEYATGNLDYAPTGGDSYRVITERIDAFLKDLEAQNVDKVLLSTHVGPMRILIGWLQQYDSPTKVLNAHFANTDIVKIVYDKLPLPLFL